MTIRSKAYGPYGGGSIVEVVPRKKYRLMVVGEGGKRQTETFHGSKTEARDRLAELSAEAKRARGVPVAEREAARVAAARTVGDVLTAWLGQVETTHKASTVAEYRRLIDTALIPAIGQMPLSDLTGHTLDALYTQWRAKGRKGGRPLSDGSVKARHRIISAALHQAERWEWIDASPARRTRPLRGAQSKARNIPSVEQAGALLNRAQNEEQVLYVLIVLACLTGARRGELVALRWSAIDLDAGRLEIRGSLTEADIRKGLVTVAPKTKAGLRTVALDATTVTILREHAAWQSDEASRQGAELAPDPYVLSYKADRGTPPWPASLGHSFKRLCRDLAGETGESWDFHLHLLRHYSATMLISLGADPVTVAHRLGHADASTTMRLYAHAVPARDVAAADAIAAATMRPALAEVSASTENHPLSRL